MKNQRTASQQPGKETRPLGKAHFSAPLHGENGSELPGQKNHAANFGKGRGKAAGNYVPMPWRALKPDTEIPFNVYVRVPPHHQSIPTYSLCCERGQIFRVNWCFRLQQLGVDVIYFSRGEKLRVMDYLGYDPEKMSAVQKERPEPEDTLIAEPPDLPDFSPKHFFTRLKNFTGLHLELALDDLEEFLEAVQRDGVVVTFIRDLWQYDPRLLVHSSNTCLLGLAFTRRLGWQKKEAHAFSLGALLHDVGMTQVPRHIFRKKGKLKPEEWLLITRHPFTGYTLLKNFTDLNSATLHMVREHHENGDGSGYPRGLHMAEIHPWARILRIVDSYEAMTAERYWRQARPPKDALWEIRLGWEQRRIYDPVYLKRYIKFLGGG